MGIVGGHGQAVLLTVIGFLVIDRLAVPLDHAQQWIAIVLMAGAFASLLAQWGLIPRLGLDPRQLVIWGSIVAAVGTAITGVADGVYGITLGYALASLGFGLYRPGLHRRRFAGGRTCPSRMRWPGMVTSINGLAYIAAPAIGVAVYGLGLAWPFLGTAALMLGLAAWTYWRVSPSSPAA